ncbi:long-chain fatty acid transport protein 4 [Folsomia candida]|uniref:Long-chain fatty acid transport protein 4 n=1 Tax=Folsomia candida TaxID=158441 RepID=A0A226D7W7_FOLCA|nr:long-chain fatty acid transport protein 4 [Folsomia candida]OXA41243.1 Long-chain fatty acid transport protein 4 [Folsomia candida]
MQKPTLARRATCQSYFTPFFPSSCSSIERRRISPTTGLVQHAPKGEAGELLGKIVKSNPFRDYSGYTDETQSKGSIVKGVKQLGDKWFRTGDTFTMDKFGYVYFKDRTGDSFRWKGENVSTLEVEQGVGKAIGVNNGVATFGVSIPGMDGKCGMVAISDINGGLNISNLHEELSRYLPPYSRPVFVRVMRNELETTGSFKLQKMELRKAGFSSALEVI